MPARNETTLSRLQEKRVVVKHKKVEQWLFVLLTSFGMTTGYTVLKDNVYCCFSRSAMVTNQIK